MKHRELLVSLIEALIETERHRLPCGRLDLEIAYPVLQLAREGVESEVISEEIKKEAKNRIGASNINYMC